MVPSPIPLKWAFIAAVGKESNLYIIPVLPTSWSLLFWIGSMAASNVNPCPDKVDMVCFPLAVEEMEQSSHAVLWKTSGGYCRSSFQESGVAGAAYAVEGLERLKAISDRRKAADAR